jgi:hypothetical protein
MAARLAVATAGAMAARVVGWEAGRREGSAGGAAMVAREVRLAVRGGALG